MGRTYVIMTWEEFDDDKLCWEIIHKEIGDPPYPTQYRVKAQDDEGVALLVF